MRLILDIVQRWVKRIAQAIADDVKAKYSAHDQQPWKNDPPKSPLTMPSCISGDSGFPQLLPDFDKYLDGHGMDDSIYPTEAQMLELTHFQNDDARKFEVQFRGYLVPSMMDGPELAPKVAKLEGLSGEWEDIDYHGIVDYMNGNRTIVREAYDWHLHNPNAAQTCGYEQRILFSPI